MPERAHLDGALAAGHYGRQQRVASRQLRIPLLAPETQSSAPDRQVTHRQVPSSSCRGDQASIYIVLILGQVSITSRARQEAVEPLIGQPRTGEAAADVLLQQAAADRWPDDVEPTIFLSCVF